MKILFILVNFHGNLVKIFTTILQYEFNCVIYQESCQIFARPYKICVQMKDSCVQMKDINLLDSCNIFPDCRWSATQAILQNYPPPHFDS